MRVTPRNRSQTGNPRLWVTFAAPTDKTLLRIFPEFRTRQISGSYYNPDNNVTKYYSNPKQIIITLGEWEERY